MTQTGLPTLSDAPRSTLRRVAAGATRRWPWIAAGLLIVIVGVYGRRGAGGRDGAAAATASPQGPPSVPVVGVSARQGEMPVYL